MDEENGIFYSDCKINEKENKIIINCKSKKPAVRIQAENSKKD